MSLMSAVVNVGVCLALTACAHTPTAPTQPAVSATPVRVLMLTTTAGFRHDSIPIARDVLTSIGPANGFAMTATEDPGRVIVENASHPAAGVRDPFTLEEEFYTFRENPRGRVQVLMSLDAASVGGSGDVPLVWTQSFGSGRSYYNALGHFASTWRDARFQQQVVAAIKWTAGKT